MGRQHMPQMTLQKGEEGKQTAIRMLREKAEELGRTPHKADFVDIEIIRIKAAHGPWPRALEAAGLKEPKNKEKPLAR